MKKIFHFQQLGSLEQLAMNVKLKYYFFRFNYQSKRWSSTQSLLNIYYCIILKSKIKLAGTLGWFSRICSSHLLWLVKCYHLYTHHVFPAPRLCKSVKFWATSAWSFPSRKLYKNRYHSSENRDTILKFHTMPIVRNIYMNIG